MTDNVIRIQDYECKSKQPNAAQPRDPSDADVIILPVIRRLNAPAPKRDLPSVLLPDNKFGS